MSNKRITTPDDQALDQLCDKLAELAPTVEDPQCWPAEQLQACADYGVYEWFLPSEHGGQAWSDADIIRGYLKLSAACLTTTFVITQYMGACRRIAVAEENDDVKARLLPDLIAGRTFATVGISHLTTSRRHLAKPVLQAEETASGFRLDGFSPWVTGGEHADYVVLGATSDDCRQLLAAVPTSQEGVSAGKSAQLVGLSASHTGPLNCNAVEVDREWLLAGPVENVMTSGAGARTGGFQTSTLAVGLAGAAIDFLEEEKTKRDDLSQPAGDLREQWTSLRTDLLSAAEGEPNCSNEQLRTRANSLVLRASQSALAAAKGSGYVIGHPAGRWCREALFFLVWSCPQPVLSANLCELATVQG